MVNFERKCLNEIKSKAVPFCAFPNIKIEEIYENAFRNNTWKFQATSLTSIHL